MVATSAWRERWLASCPSATELLERLDRRRQAVADPERADDDIRRLVGVMGAEAAAAWFTVDPQRINLLVGLGSVSRWALDAVYRQVDLFENVVDGSHYREVWGRAGMAAALRTRLQAVNGLTDASEDCDEDTFATALMRFKECQYIRIILGDITGSMRFESVVAELSDLVDCLAEVALHRAQVVLSAKWGRPDVHFAIFGMGKLGGRELNYSSDIDLIFIYKNAGSEEWEFHEYYQRLGAAFIRILDEPSAAGRLFRVDMRLRPEGDRGALALSLRETIDYYYSIGRPWERQAMIKARPIAGDLVLGKNFLDELRPWVYVRDPHWEELDGTRSMRRRIEERRAIADIKTGAGGIRDIEFLVQFFQMSHGGRLPELRGRATLPVLRTLADSGILPAEDVVELEAHYRFLRIVEHRLQVWEDRQLHDIPLGETERRDVAGRCGFIGPQNLQEFDAKLANVRDRVRALADEHYLRDSQHEDAITALLVQEECDDALIELALGGNGFKDLRLAATHFQRMAREPFFVLSRARTERALASLIPAILPHISASPDPDQTLTNLARITDAVGGRASFYDLMAGNPLALRLICDLAGWATYLVNLLGEVPGLADEVIDTLNMPLRSAPVLRQIAKDLIRDLEDLVPPLRFFQARETMAAAVRDLNGLSLRGVNEHISNVAVATITAVLEHCLHKRIEAWGMPVDEQGVPSRFAIVGLGKLGSRALSYASDMDVIFVYDGNGTCPLADRDSDAFWTRITQDCMRILDDGRLYEIDPRLRPWGDQGPLVASLESVRRYWSEPRDIWERMAMLRMAPIAGDEGLGNECVEFIRGTTFSTPLPADAKAQVRDMRSRLEESVAGRDHVKRGYGGYVDHEFIAHFYCFGLDPATIPIGSSISEILHQLGDIGRIPTEAATQLIEGLLWLRGVEARQRLSCGKAVSSIPTDPVGRLDIAKRCHKDDIASFDEAMDTARSTGRGWFDRLMAE